MISKGDIMTYDLVKDDKVFFSSYKGRYIIMDNLDEKYKPVIKERPEVFNTEYVYVTIVTKGTLHLKISGTELNVKENDFVVIMPCMKVEVKESRCKFFSMLTMTHIVNDIYEKIGLTDKVGLTCFCYHHYTLTPKHVSIIYNEYKRMKAEHLQNNKKRKEVCLRAMMAAYECQLFNFIDSYEENKRKRPQRQRELYNRFLRMLCLYYRRERSVQYYADRLEITPKYLSNLSMKFAGVSASNVIDQYVAYHVKRMLYTHDYNIKKISEMFHFPSQSFFGRYFSRIVGMSPTSYVKINNRKAIIDE